MKFYVHPTSATPPTVFVDNTPRCDTTLVRPDTIGPFDDEAKAKEWVETRGWKLVSKQD